jgi:hypothetical protein
MASPEQALRWIVDILNRHQVPFQIVGGLAARAYGATRLLHDIDLYIPMSRFPDIQPDVADYVIWGPEHQKDGHWDLVYVKIDYDGQRIEIGDGDNTKIYDAKTGSWIKQKIDFAGFEMIELYGVVVPVIPKQQLIKYKTILSREVDDMDLSQIR